MRVLARIIPYPDPVPVVAIRIVRLLAGCGPRTRALDTDIFPRDVAEESHVIPGYVRHWEGIVANRERCAAMADRRARG